MSIDDDQGDTVAPDAHPRPLTPYDTGERCEPKLWQPDEAAVLEALNDDDIGNVDFDDDAGRTVVTVHVSRGADGSHTVHVIPFSDVAGPVRFRRTLEGTSVIDAGCVKIELHG